MVPARPGRLIRTVKKKEFLGRLTHTGQVVELHRHEESSMRHRLNVSASRFGSMCNMSCLNVR